MKKLISCIVLVAGIHLCVFSQRCPGGLGDNLFTAGDFGSGEPFALEQDPMIAPGYNYNRFGPPPDGDYMITNDMEQWDFVYGTWLVIGDNSNDPNGYMMVVNASFEPGLFYEETIEGLCDNTSYEFSADIINLVRRNVTGHHDPNVAFLLDDEVVLNTGNIKKTEAWETFSFSFDTDPGQTSVKLSLRNNAPGGTGNDLALDNISFRACGPRSEIGLVDGTELVCEEDLPIRLVALLDGQEDPSRKYQWEVSLDNRSTWQPIPDADQSQLAYESLADLNPQFRFVTAASSQSFANEKCRFYSQPFGVQISKRTYEIFDTICGGTSLELSGATLVNPGLYIEEFESKLGCDSIVMIHLDTVLRETVTGRLDQFDPLCYGAPNGVVEAVEISGGYPPYHLDIDGQDYSGAIASGLSAGAYDILLEDKYNCFRAFNIQLEDPVQLDIDAGPDLELFLGEEVSISLHMKRSLSLLFQQNLRQKYRDLIPKTHP